MSKKRGKSVSFDAMIKFFMQNYNIPTKKDIDRIMAKLDRLEAEIKKAGNRSGGRGTAARKKKAGSTASDTVLNVIKRSKQGTDFDGIQKKTGFDSKKLRNIIFRLNKLGRIKRKSRGVYLAQD